jgi:prepilin peptidase CpaA
MSFLPLLALLLGLRIAISDLYARRVPNIWLAGAAAAAVVGMLAAPLLGTSFPWFMHLLAALLGLVALMPFYLLGWMGAGDVKYFAVLGGLLGLQALLPVWIMASLLAGLHVACAVGLPRLASHLPAGLQMLHARAVHDWQLRPAALQMKMARQGRVGLPFAAYLAMSSIVWVLATSAGGTR